MIKKIRNSLTVKICILMAVLLLASSGITYAAVVRFLPTYYSNQLQKDLDVISRGMLDGIRSYHSIDEAANVIELYEASSKVSVVILDGQGEKVWPRTETVIEEILLTGSGAGDAQMDEETAAFASDVLEDSCVQEYRVEAEANSAVEEDMEATADSAAEENIEMIADSAVAEEVEAVAGDAVNVQAQENPSAVKQYSFELGEKKYTMVVSGGMQPVNQAMEILKQIFPYILAVSVFVAVLFAVGLSLYLTMPVVRLSRISKRMASLDFGSSYQGKRTDEIGALGTDLNELSANLSHALSDLKEANARLKSDIDKEREIEKKRIAFFSAVSHELKTPITILKGHLSGMLQGVGEYQNRDYYLQRSQETTEKMEDMVRELLTVSRIESQAFRTKKTDIAELLRQKIADMTELIEDKKLGLEVTIPERLYAEVNPGMLEKVFSNLLMNAVRYTPEGNGNEIRVILQPQEKDGRTAVCRVENTGVSIPEEAIPHLFEAFYRAEQSRNRQTGGSGLGLYIVRMILEQHKAEYRIENIEDGVRFFFLL